MAEVFAGFVCGYALALLSTPLLAISLLRLRATSVTLARLLPAGTGAVSVGVLVHGGLMLFWTAVGILFGLVLLAMEDAGAAAGSANAAFTLFVASLTLAVIAPIAIVARRLRSLAIAAGLLVLLVFGWLMPHLAGLSNFE